MSLKLVLSFIVFCSCLPGITLQTCGQIEIHSITKGNITDQNLTLLEIGDPIAQTVWKQVELTKNVVCVEDCSETGSENSGEGGGEVDDEGSGDGGDEGGFW